LAHNDYRSAGGGVFAFVFHELSHRVAARRYGFPAVYRVWIPGLILGDGAAISMAVCGPGGVVIQIAENTAENREMGKSALAGPVVKTWYWRCICSGFIIVASWIAYSKSSTGNETSQIQTYLA